MKHTLKILIFFMIVSVKLNAQDSLYIRTYGLKGYNYGEKIIQTADSGFTILGNKSGFVGNTDVYLIKTDKYGGFVWDKAYGSDEVDWAEDFVKTKDNGYAIAGYITIPQNNDDYNILLMKTDSVGTLLWMKNYGGSNWDLAHSLVETPDSGFIVTGETYSYGNGNNDAFVLRTDKNGDSLWMKTYGGQNSDNAYDISACNDGSFILTGSTRSFGKGGYDIYLLKIDTSGDTLWTRTYGDTLDDKAFAGIETSDNGIAVTGSTYNFNANGKDAYILKTDENGNQQWLRVYGGSLEEEQYDIIEKPYGYLFTAGYTSSFGYVGTKELYMINTDSYGWFMTGPTFGGSKEDVANSCINTLSGGLAIIGSTESMGLGLSNILLLNSDSMGNTNINAYIHITNISENPVEEKNLNIFPNPASDQLTIVNDPNNKLDAILFYDILGNLYKEIHPGNGSISNIDLTDLPDGIFLIIIRDEKEQYARKIIHISEQH